VQASAPPSISEAARAAGGGGYNGIGPPPRDYQERILGELGIDGPQMLASMSPGTAAIAATPEEIVAP
jgi:hypothetical protein